MTRRLTLVLLLASFAWRCAAQSGVEAAGNANPPSASATLDLAHYLSGMGDQGLCFGVSLPFAYAPKQKSRDRVVDRHWAATVHAVAFATQGRGELSFRGELGILRKHVRPNGFYHAYGVELGYVLTTAESLESNVNSRKNLTSSTYLNGFGIGPLTQIGYDFSKRKRFPLRAWTSLRASIDLFEEDPIGDTPGIVMPIVTTGVTVPLFRGR